MVPRSVFRRIKNKIKKHNIKVVHRSSNDSTKWFSKSRPVIEMWEKTDVVYKLKCKD